MYLLVEGGVKLTNSFLNQKLFNQFYLIKSNINASDKEKEKKYKILNNFSQFFRYKEHIKTFTGNDKITRFYNV